MAGSIQNRLLALALLVSLIAAGWSLVLAPTINALKATREQTAILEDRLQRFRRSASQLPALEKQSEALKKSFAESGLAFSDEGVDLAAARLQNLVSEIVKAHRGEMRMVQRKDVHSSSESPGRVGISASFAASNVGMVAILTQLEQLRPVLSFDSVSIRSLLPSAPPLSSDGSPTGPFEDDLILNLDLEVSAFLRLSEMEPK